MELKEILAISGQPGLYKYVAQSSRGVIVESLSDGKRMNAASNSKVSALTEISIFTEGEDIPLAEVFTKIYEHNVKWTDKNGVEHTEQKSTNAYYFKATSDTVFYEAIIPAQKAGSTVYWLIVVTNENGLSSVTEAQQYSVYAI